MENISVNIEEAYERGRSDINFFAALCIPTVCLFPFPPFYVAIFHLLTTASEEQRGKLLRFALGLPRGHAKTTFIKVLIAWFICYDKLSFILIVCSNSELAENLLADIHDILSSPNITTIYGMWIEGLAIDSADTKKGTYHARSVTLVARGWSAGIRGLNLQNERPDFIFCDDAQTRKNDESPTERGNLLKELVGTIFKAITPIGTRRIVYVGNMYSEECILNLFHKNTKWTSMVTGAILADGTPLWPELFSIEELQESYEHDEALGLSHVWFAEIMNDPLSVARSLLPHPIPPSPTLLELLRNHDGAYITIDPAGFRKTSDDNVIAVHVIYEKIHYTVQVVKGILNPQELIREALTLALKWEASLIGVESVAYQQTLAFWISYFKREYGFSDDLRIVELSPHGRSKETRIRTFVQNLYSQIHFLACPEVRRDFTWQASLYKIGQKDNKDDLLDAIAYSDDIRNEFSYLIVPPKLRVIESSCSVVNNNFF